MNAEGEQPIRARSSERDRKHIPGLELSRRFYREAIRPQVDAYAPGLRHAAALIGPGSEVLGFDDETSTDHHWGPRVMLFVEAADHAAHAERLHGWLAERLPYQFLGYATHFTPPDPDDNGTQLRQTITRGPINHRVSVAVLGDFTRHYLGWAGTQPLTPADWLSFPAQKLATLTAGEVYHDDLGPDGPSALQAQLAYYPRDVWLYRLAAGWARLGQEEHLMGRAGSVGDELGAALIGARLVRDVMNLAFLMERQYAPYPKWFGTAFRQLACAQTLLPWLTQSVRAPTWEAREAALVPAYEALAVMHNRLDLTPPLPTRVTEFHGRGFRVIALHGFADALLDTIEDPTVRALGNRSPIGNIDQVSDNTDLLEDVSRYASVRTLYDIKAEGATQS